MMSIPFPAGVLCTRPNEGGRGPGIPPEDKHFCVGQDTRLRLWYGRRSQLDVDRGPYTSLSAFFITTLNQPITVDERTETALLRAAQKELAYLEREGRLPVPGAVAVGPRREPGPLSHRVVTRPQGPSVISASAIPTSSKTMSSFRGRHTLTGKSLTYSIGNTPRSSPVFPCGCTRTLPELRVKSPFRTCRHCTFPTQMINLFLVGDGFKATR